MQNEPVDLASDANESMSERSPATPASDVAEDDGILSDLKFYVHFPYSMYTLDIHCSGFLCSNYSYLHNFSFFE